MIVYEFYLGNQFRGEAFEALCESFYSLGKVMNRWDDPKDEETGDPIEASCVYAISRTPETHWVQLLVDDSTPAHFITAIERRINGLCDGVFTQHPKNQNIKAPRERSRAEIGI